jgi:single-strand DNA-binding protein
MSLNINTVIVGGRLTRDVEVKYTPSGKAVAEVTVAVGKSYFDKQTNSRKDETTFVEVTLWGKTAEAAAEHLKKGSTVVVEGFLKTDTWDDRQTGQKRSKTKVTAENVHFGDRSPSNGRNASQPPAREPESVGATTGTDEEVPF